MSVRILALALALLSPVALFAQRDLGTLTGTITDTTGAVVSTARVTITEQATGVKDIVATDSSGTYIRPLLKPGTYTVEVEATGFNKAIQRDIPLAGGDRVGRHGLGPGAGRTRSRAGRVP